jgi:hypothetical protein
LRQRSDVDLLGDLNGVIDLDAEVANGDFECLAVIDGVVFVGVGEAQKFTDNIVAPRPSTIRTDPWARALASTSLRRFCPAPSFSALRSRQRFSGSASAVSHWLRGTDLSGWGSDCWNITRWYREG